MRDTQQDHQAYRERYARAQNEDEAMRAFADRPALGTKAEPMTIAAIAAARDSQGQRRERQQRPAPRAIRQAQLESRDHRGDPGQQRARKLDSEPGIPGAAREDLEIGKPEDRQRRDGRDGEEPEHGAQDRRPQAAHRCGIGYEAADDLLHSLNHASSPPSASSAI